MPDHRFPLAHPLLRSRQAYRDTRLLCAATLTMASRYRRKNRALRQSIETEQWHIES